jgi:gluconolactonase
MPGPSTRWELSAPTRYPDPDVVVLDPRFHKIFIGNTGIQRIATGFAFTEGPAWFGDGRYLLFSDIPNDRILRWDETTGGISVFRSPSHYANGNTRDRQGRLSRASTTRSD